MNATDKTRMTATESSVETCPPQLELSFAGSPACPSARGHRRQFNRANWWFQRMRQAVDRACAWHPAPPRPRPEQTWFPNTHRPLTVAAGLGPEENRGQWMG